MGQEYSVMSGETQRAGMTLLSSTQNRHSYRAVCQTGEFRRTFLVWCIFAFSLLLTQLLLSALSSEMRSNCARKCAGAKGRKCANNFQVDIEVSSIDHLITRKGIVNFYIKWIQIGV